MHRLNHSLIMGNSEAGRCNEPKSPHRLAMSQRDGCKH